MKKKFFKIISIILGIVFLLLIVGNFGLNYWLKNNLPDYIKKKSEFLVTYKNLDVHLGTGNIFATGISISNKNPENENVIRITGTIDTLSISRMGIVDAVFKKKISTSDLVLNHPDLKIILAKKKIKTGKEQNPFSVENIKITRGNIQIFKEAKRKLLSVNDLNLTLENLQFNEELNAKKLPFSFDKYNLNGKNLFFRTNGVYVFTAKYLTTKEAQFSIKDFAMIPLVTPKNFLKFYPNQKNLLDIKSTEMEFKNLILKDNKITLDKVRFENPEVKMFTTNAKSSTKEKQFDYEVQLENVLFNHAKVDIEKANGSPLFNAENLDVSINKLLMNEETVKGKIPFQYNDFKINGKNLNYFSAQQKVLISAISVNPKLLDLKNVSIQPTVSKSEKMLMNLSTPQILVKIKDFSFIENKLKLNIENVLVNTLKGKIIAGEKTRKKKSNLEGISFPIIIKNVNLKNADLVFESKNKPLSFQNLNANIQNIELDKNSKKDGIAFKMGFYSLSARDFNYKTQFYHLTSTLLKVNNNTVQLNNFAMVPTVSRAQFIRMIPTEKDLYDLKANQIVMKGKWDFLSANQFLEASQLTLNGVNANVFRSKIPNDDLTEKPLYSKLLRSIKFPMFIQNLDIQNSVLVYEEDTKKSEGPGKLTFNNFNLNAKNLNSAKMKGKPTLIPIKITCAFMNASPMNVNWSFDTVSKNDAFSISGNVSDLPASRINPFVEPYLKVRATGLISDLIFNFKGNYSGLNGSLKMKHQDLKVSLLSKSGDKDKILSAIANIFVKSDSGKYPESVEVEDVERDKTKSFFNLLWRGIEQGLKKTLIGINAPKTEESIKKTISNTKTALQENKKDLKETKTEIKEKVEEKGLLKNIFKKKSEK